MTAGGAADRRRQAERGGRRAEFLAALALMAKGFSILERRFRTPAGEVDLVAKRGSLLVFAEVKARSTADAGVEAVTAPARRRIERAAALYLARRAHLAACMMRYDILTVSGWRVRHRPDAWREGE
ncbi:MAG: YraN family protein [Oricola sp.]|jgi:putative endonuclease|nr:YraN family protein [Oricola sp.]